MRRAPGQRVDHRLGLAALGVLVATLGAATPDVGAAAPVHRVLLGTVGGGPATSYDRVAAFQEQAGRQMDTVRVYAAWDSAFPDPLSAAVAAHGQMVVLSVKARTRSGQPVSYRSIAAAVPGTSEYAQLQRWAAALTLYGRPLLFSFNHEPDVHKSDDMGTAEEYVRAWQRVVTVFREAGVRNLEYVFIATAPHWASTDARSAASFYPGDAYVDDIAADGYNFFDCSRIALMPWTWPRELFEPFRRFGVQHPSKGLLIVEFGSVEDRADPTRKARWYGELEQLLQEPGWRQIRSVAQWYDADQAASRCNWRIDSSPATLQAFQRWAQDPVYAGAAGLPPAAVRQVAVAARNGSAVLTWAPAGPGTSPVTSYTVRVGETGQTVRVSGRADTFTYTPPAGARRTYTFSVSATNAAGTGGPSPRVRVELGR